MLIHVHQISAQKNPICTQVHITKKVNYFLMTEEQYFKLQTLEPQFRQEQA